MLFFSDRKRDFLLTEVSFFATVKRPVVPAYSHLCYRVSCLDCKKYFFSHAPLYRSKLSKNYFLQSRRT